MKYRVGNKVPCYSKKRTAKLETPKNTAETHSLCVDFIRTRKINVAFVGSVESLVAKEPPVAGSGVPLGHYAQAILGFVEELVVNDDPEYKWIDKIRTPRASNEARQTLFSKLSGRRRLHGTKGWVPKETPALSWTTLH